MGLMHVVLSDLGNNLCSKNKGVDQLCGYRTADLHLCFPIYAKNQVFSCCGSYGKMIHSDS